MMFCLERYSPKNLQLCFIILCAFVFILGWVYIVSINHNTQPLPVSSHKMARSPVETTYTINVVNVQNRSDSSTLSEALRNGFGKHVLLNIATDNSKKVVRFKYEELKFPTEIKVEPVAVQDKELSDRYIRVYDRGGEQMSMNTNNLFALSWQAKKGRRKVAVPLVSNSLFWVRGGHDLGIYFNLTHMEKMLSANGYATMIDLKEFNKECTVDIEQAFIHFLYGGPYIVPYTQRRFGLNKEQYDNLVGKTKIKGWRDCPEISHINNKNEAKYFAKFKKVHFYCVDPTIIKDWDILEKDIVKGVKCLTIIWWTGVSEGRGRAHFTEEGRNIHPNDIKFALQLNNTILKVVETFQEKFFMKKPFIAIHIRGESILKEHTDMKHDVYGSEGLMQYLRLLKSVVVELRKITDISHTFIATDLGKYGSKTVGKYKKDSPDFHKYLMSDIGGVVYEPPVDWDRGAVALVDLGIISHARHLITVGGATFQQWVRAKYLENHRHDNKRNWTLISLHKRALH